MICRLFAMFLLGWSTQLLAQVTITPVLPKSLDAVVVHIPAQDIGREWTSPEVSMEGNHISVVLHEPGTTGGLVADLDWSIGSLPAGSYDVDITWRPANDVGTAVGHSSFVVAPRAPHVGSTTPLANYTDLWWNPSESGWGLTIHHHPSDILFLVWFVYDQDGKPVWYVVPTGQWQSSNSYTGAVYKTTGPYFGSTFNPDLVARTPAGTATIQFLGYDKARFQYTIDGVVGQKSIVRQGF